MPTHKYAQGKYSRAICDICGLTYKFLQLKLLPEAVFGAPTNKLSNIKACPDCYDQVNPQSFLPIAVQQHGYDPEQLQGPRPDVYPLAFAVKWVLPGQRYQNGGLANVLTLYPGFSGNIQGNGMYAGYSVTVQPPAGITLTSLPSLLSPQVVRVGVLVSTVATAGTYIMSVTDATGNPLNGQIIIS